MRIWYTLAYIALIVVVNWAFKVVPMVELPGGIFWPPVALLVGFVFIVRDFAQREVGHWVLGAMLVGAVLTYFMVDPAIAIASATAFLISEIADWAVYTFTGKTLSQRILLSSAVGTPVDSVVFLSMAGFFSVTGAVVMTLSKMVGAFIVWWMIRRREHAEAAAG